MTYPMDFALRMAAHQMNLMGTFTEIMATPSQQPQALPEPAPQAVTANEQGDFQFALDARSHTGAPNTKPVPAATARPESGPADPVPASPPSAGDADWITLARTGSAPLRFKGWVLYENTSSDVLTKGQATLKICQRKSGDMTWLVSIAAGDYLLNLAEREEDFEALATRLEALDITAVTKDAQELGAEAIFYAARLQACLDELLTESLTRLDEMFSNAA